MIWTGQILRIIMEFWMISMDEKLDDDALDSAIKTWN